MTLAFSEVARIFSGYFPKDKEWCDLGHQVLSCGVGQLLSLLDPMWQIAFQKDVLLHHFLPNEVFEVSSPSA